MNVDVRNLYDAAQTSSKVLSVAKEHKDGHFQQILTNQPTNRRATANQPTHLSRGQIVNEAKPVAEVRPHCVPLSPALSQPDQRVNVSCDQDSGF